RHLPGRLQSGGTEMHRCDLAWQRVHGVDQVRLRIDRDGCRIPTDSLCATGSLLRECGLDERRDGIAGEGLDHELLRSISLVDREDAQRGGCGKPIALTGDPVV